MRKRDGGAWVAKDQKEELSPHIILGSRLVMVTNRCPTSPTAVLPLSCLTCPPPPPSRLQVFPYVLEIAMLAIFPTLMGVSLGNAYAADIIQKDFNFIVNSALAGITLISIIVTYPLGVQHVQEQV